jgi:ABC-2 type transport system permease protein
MVLLKPVSIFGVELGHAAALRTTGVLFEFVPSIFLYSLMCYPEFMTGASLCRFLLCIVLSFLLAFMISFLVGLSAFFIKNNLSMRNLKFIIIGLFGGAYFPIDFYPVWIRNIVDWLPFKYVFYVPLQLLLNRMGNGSFGEYARIIAIQVAWIFGLFLLCKLLWDKSVKRFCAVGG